MALTAAQRRVLTRLKSIGAQVGASPKEIKAAIETGLVESNLSNPSGGDGDSAGWRQERASLYPNPRNLDASIRRFYAETRGQRGKAGSAGQLAAAVQRPAAQYRGRYQTQSGRADVLRGTTSRSPAQASTTPGVDNSGLRAQLVSQFLGRSGQNPVDFAMGIRAARDVPATTTTTPKPVSTSAAAGQTGHGASKLLELFWQGEGGINAKNNKKVPQGFVSGHTDHVHVAAGPKTVIALGQLAQRMGLHVGENDHFGGVNPVHVANSYHYRGQAIDVSGTPAQMRAYAHRVAAMHGIQ